MNNSESYPQHARWKDGARQELIPEDGETLQDAIAFMRNSLKQYGHDDLTFSEDDVESIDSKYYITLRNVISDIV
ncbi:hypothetical protein [Dyadobacter psychrotolerans]|jgi:hypothetical protein|uniref:Uncharacterized protein n=1 Tax=Dyadobacter psychrotolerans TaxID=2541721 RepID=A0A4R5DAD3_9BACT|nr:hypothetical protein [Dyadobacter psychrotolerans]TDE09787.1 hypothetical protein E0F88_29800 [Dyadobacter psychrotolerans]